MILVRVIVALLGAVIGAFALWAVWRGVAMEGMWVTCRKTLQCWVTPTETPVAFWTSVVLLTALGVSFLAPFLFGVHSVWRRVKRVE